jgi:hypothetical protein
MANIVVGNPRSGTSLMMDCFVQSLGREYVLGDQFPSAGRANHALFDSGEAITAAKDIALEGEHSANPLGFWEGPHVFSGVIDLNYPDHWAKVIFGALERSTPSCIGKVVVAMRNPAEQNASQSVFNNRNGTTLDLWYARTLSGMKWLKNAEIDYLVVDYNNMVRNPDEQLDRVSAYTGLEIRKHRVRQDLYRNKAPLPNHEASDLYLSLLNDTFKPENFPFRPVNSTAPPPERPRARIDISPEAKRRRSERIFVCKACEFRQANVCSKLGRRILRAVETGCPEGLFPED